jgi:membrane-bound lytic murein transglycosylase D
MKPRVCLAVLAAALVAFGSGCATLKPAPGNTAWATDGTTGAAAVEPSETGAKRHAEPKELLDLARKHYAMGLDLLGQGNYDGARKEFLQGLASAGSVPETAGTGEAVRRERETLITDLSLGAVRAGRLRDGVPKTPVTAERALDFQYNPRVERWLQYWLTNGRETMGVYLGRSGRYIDRVREIIREERLPEDLAFLPVIESGYSPMAYSPMAAAGTWQFIRSTAKIYNLSMDQVVDERRDVEKATRAACRYLRKLHDQFGSWDLALAAYNCGENAVERAIARAGTKDYWKLDLPEETENYVPKFYSAMMVAKDPDFYGFRVQAQPPQETKTVYLPKPVDLQAICTQTGICYQDMKVANPELLGRHTPPKSTNYPLQVPADVHDEFMTRFDAIPDEAKYLSEDKIDDLMTPVKRVAHRGRLGKARAAALRHGRAVTHVVKKGETLFQIARKYGTTVETLRRLNGTSKTRILRPGQRITIQRRA